MRANPLAHIQRSIATLRWMWRGVIGADAYERYCAHLRTAHPDATPPSEREFWRAKYEDMDRNPRSRCC